MQRIAPDRPHLLFDTAATRRLEASAAAALAPHTLMQRAGQATARLALALAPHARTFWFACGGGNNGGDGLEAALLLHRGGHPVVVTWLGTPETAPADARQSWQRAQEAGVPFAAEPPFLGPQDLCVDALLGIGLRADPRPRRPDARLLQWLARMHACAAPTLCVDLPSGLVAESGQYIPGLAPAHPGATAARHTLSLLTLKPGLFTGQGRDAAGSVWFDDLGVPASTETPCAWLAGPPASAVRAHASHKGSYGDVAVIGGEGLQARGMGMTGAALLAASAALHAGAGRVMVALLDAGALPALPQQPELMLRRCDALALDHATVVCGCGGGAAVAAVLPDVLQQSARLVLDADALNAMAADPHLQHLLRERGRQGRPTVLTPHPLEAARLLAGTTAAVQADRLAAARTLADQYGCTVLLKGSGSVIAAPGRTPLINPTGNARLATGGTGDVLAGLVGARLAAEPAQAGAAFAAAGNACWEHGAAADRWPAGRSLTAGALARALNAG
ncbi:NAD(P)H-hydrate dehydratase [Diaphorobacter sp.]|uniref:NAD(P)H-hydrate dehydratase n=1 Tax=Diaphorobacter sp. TaxID=1934310 RepID=UPI00258EA3C6|nr:NAD(P)H-hydrate dehydratase [Diaphorobacter sp.]